MDPSYNPAADPTSFVFRPYNISKRTMPNDGKGCVSFKLINTSGNEPKISKAMRFSQYVNNTKGFKNVQRMSYAQYVEKYGPLEFPLVPPTKSNPLFQINYSN
jgi:hypothetical protein